MVECGGYRMAWVGFAECDDLCTIRPAAAFGFEDGYFDALHLSWADNEYGRGPSGTAIRSKQPVSSRNIALDPSCAPWREAALQRGYASSCAIPLMASDGHCFGALNVYSLEVDAFDEGGNPQHQRGVSSEPGVYFLGLPWLSRRGSSFIWGVWHDAKYLADQIAIQRAYAEYRPPA